MLDQPLGEITNMRFLNRQDIEKISTEAIRNIYLGENLTLCKILGKYKIYLDGRDGGVVPNILMDGFWESWVTKFIAQHVDRGNYCIDLGANFGYYSLLLADLCGTEGGTLAIEPNGHLAKLLEMTSNINACNFKVAKIAASNYTGETILSIPEHLWGSGTIITKAESAGENKRETVKTDTLDNIIFNASFPRVDFIKMDCEGAEPWIFEGMPNILQQNPQLKIVMEYSPHLYMEPEKFTDLIFNRFQVGRIDGNSNSLDLSAADIPRLLSLDDHIDLFLSPKP